MGLRGGLSFGEVISIRRTLNWDIGNWRWTFADLMVPPCQVASTLRNEIEMHVERAAYSSEFRWCMSPVMAHHVISRQRWM